MKKVSSIFLVFSIVLSMLVFAPAGTLADAPASYLDVEISGETSVVATSSSGKKATFTLKVKNITPVEAGGVDKGLQAVEVKLSFNADLFEYITADNISVNPGTNEFTGDMLAARYTVPEGMSVSVNETGAGTGELIIMVLGETQAFYQTNGVTEDDSISVSVVLNVKKPASVTPATISAGEVVGTINYNNYPGTGDTLDVSVSPKNPAPAAPAAPAIESQTPTSVRLFNVDGNEYRVNSGAWQNEGVFMGLTLGETYQFYQRKKETETTFASEISAGTSTTMVRNPAPAAPGAPGFEATDATSVTLVFTRGYEYRMDGGAWQVSNRFTGLVSASVHEFEQRIAQTEGSNATEASPASAKLKCVVNYGPLMAPELDTAGPTSIKLKEAAEDAGKFEYRRDNGAWQAGLEFTGLEMNTEYSFYKRYIGTGAVSPALTVRTLAEVGDLIKSEYSSLITVTEIGGIKMIQGIKKGVNGKTKADILAMFNNSDSMTVVDKNGNAISDTALVGTGFKIRVMDNGVVVDEVDIVIKGDVNGDGNFNSNDIISMVNNYNIHNLSGAFLSAANIVTAEGARPNSNDIQQIIYYYQHLSSCLIE